MSETHDPFMDLLLDVMVAHVQVHGSLGWPVDAGEIKRALIIDQELLVILCVHDDTTFMVHDGRLIVNPGRAYPFAKGGEVCHRTTISRVSNWR